MSGQFAQTLLGGIRLSAVTAFFTPRNGDAIDPGWFIPAAVPGHMDAQRIGPFPNEEAAWDFIGLHFETAPLTVADPATEPF